MRKISLNIFPAIIFTVYVFITILLISLYIPFSCTMIDKIAIYLYYSDIKEEVSHIILTLINMLMSIVSVGLGTLYIFITGYIIEKIYNKWFSAKRALENKQELVKEEI